MRTNHVHSPALRRVPPYGIRGEAMAESALRLVGKDNMDKQKALDVALAQIERAFGKGSVMKLGSREGVADVEVVSTGSLGLDIALGIGGLPPRPVLAVFRPQNSRQPTPSPPR